MGLQSLEHRLERMVDGVFSRRSRGSIRPIELGRRLVREMDANRSVDVKGRRIVPNDFTVMLNAVDHAGFGDIEDALVAELAEAAREYAREEGYHFMGPVTVELAVDNTLRSGRFGIVSQLKQATSGPGMGSLVLPSGQRVYVNNGPITIGRLPECEVSVNDSNISRRHARGPPERHRLRGQRPRIHQWHDGERRQDRRRAPPHRRRHHQRRCHAHPVRGLLTVRSSELHVP